LGLVGFGSESRMVIGGSFERHAISDIRERTGGVHTIPCDTEALRFQPSLGIFMD
jgi:hypothetical protein